MQNSDKVNHLISSFRMALQIHRIEVDKMIEQTIDNALKSKLEFSEALEKEIEKCIKVQLVN